MQGAVRNVVHTTLRQAFLGGNDVTNEDEDREDVDGEEGLDERESSDEESPGVEVPVGVLSSEQAMSIDSLVRTLTFELQAERNTQRYGGQMNFNCLHMTSVFS